MKWTQSEVIALARVKCRTCRGTGLVGIAPCDCVTRAMFTACHNRFRACVQKPKSASVVKLERAGMSGGRSSRVSYGRKTEEYIADFYLICKRTLPESDWLFFSSHYLLLGDARLMIRRFNITRAEFDRVTQAMEAKLGRVFRETAPFGLYPLDEYFSGVTRDTVIAACVPVTARLRGALRPPMRPAMVDVAA